MYEITSFKNQEKPEPNLDLPNDYVERLILKKFMTDPQYTPFIAENFKEEYFDNSTIKWALHVGSRYYKEYKSIPPMELLTNLLIGLGKNEEASLVASYANLNVEADDLFIQSSIKGFYQSKAFFYLIFSNSERIMRDRTVTPYINELQRISGLDFNFDLGFNYFENIEEHIFDLTTPEKRLDTGYEQLNNLCNGGFPEDGKCLIVLMAQAGLGKSMTMHNLASNMIPLGKKVLIVSLEMTEQIYSRRISANMTKRCIDSLDDEDNIDAIRKNVENINTIDGAGLIIKEFPPSALRALTLGNYIERLILSGFKPDIIFVDYLNLMMPNNAVNGGGSYERVGDIAKELRALSYMFEIPIISATQSNRGGFNSSDIDMENISESAQIAHHADALFALHSDIETAPNDFYLKVLKNRFGGKINSRIQFNMNYDNLRLTEIDFNRNPEPEQLTETNSLVEDITKELSI